MAETPKAIIFDFATTRGMLHGRVEPSAARAALHQTTGADNPARAAIDRYFSDKNDGLVAWLAEAKPAVTVAAHFLVWLRSNGFVVVPCLPPAAA